MTSPLQAQIATELRRRAELLPQDVQTWRTLTKGNVAGMGIHRSQVAAIEVLLDGLVESQTAVLAELDPTLAPDEFSERRLALEQELTATHGIMAVFRFILAQRSEGEHYHDVLDAADLIAAGCYRSCIELAQDWGILTEDQFREPPLTYLNAMISPMAITRRHPFGAFRLPLDDYRELKLPISVISLPFHHTVAIWTFCSIYHEVGHVVDQDLNLTAAVKTAIEQRLAASGTDPERISIWRGWVGEMIADIFGVLFGGPAFARALQKMLFLPRADVIELKAGSTHPVPYVRMFLVSALLRGCGLEAFVPVADELEQTWRDLYGRPADLEPYVAECAAVAAVLLDEPLPSLQGKEPHRLRDFAPTLAADQKSIARLVPYLAVQFKRPEPKMYPVRLVPAAAQLAVQAASGDADAASADIQRRTLQFIKDIPRPEFLGKGTMTMQRKAHLRELVRGIRFEAGAEET